MAVAQGGEDVYASLLLTDTYLPGALVLAHSLRDAGTKKKLAVLVTLDSVSAEVVTQLKIVYDYVIPVPRIRNERPGNLYLMNRPDLHSAFTKINLWKQTQFRKIVYLDADVVAYRAPDELFDDPHAFSAAPDIGWPDLFNTGVMVLTPNMGDYYAMMAMAERGISFDGADQGLLNMHFKNTYNRLSFTYNVTPSAHYQYVPAYKHFQSSINLVHFIGTEKPWLQGREKSKGDSPFDEIAGRWWAVYDRHYRHDATSAGPKQVSRSAAPAEEIVQYFVKGEYQPRVRYTVPVGESPRNEFGALHGQQHPPSPAPLQAAHQRQYRSQQQQREQQEQQHHEHQGQDQRHEQPQHFALQPEHPPATPNTSQPPPYYPQQQQDGHFGHPPGHDNNHPGHYPEHQDQHHVPNQHVHQHQGQTRPGSPSRQPENPPPLPSVSFSSPEGTRTEARAEQGLENSTSQPPAPPPESKYEHYQPPPTQSWDAQRHPPPADSKPEAFNFPQTHYKMSSDLTQFVPPERYPSPPRNMWYIVPEDPPAPADAEPTAIFPWESYRTPPSRVFPQAAYLGTSASETHLPSPGGSGTASETGLSVTGSVTSELKNEPHNLHSQDAGVVHVNPWSSFPRSNAWDDIPEINRYVDAIQKHRRTRSQGLGEIPTELGLRESSWGRRGSRVTDFPSEEDRPSLPVTPAPIRRPRFWGGGQPGIGLEDEEDDKRLPAAEGVVGQSEWDPEAQLQVLAKQQSERVLQMLGKSSASKGDVIGIDGRDIPSRQLPFGSEDMKSPTYVAFTPPEVISPKPVKPHIGTSPVQNILDVAMEVAPKQTTGASSVAIEPPSYQGPGAAFEKGEDYPTKETPMPPTEEERDVLET